MSINKKLVFALLIALFSSLNLQYTVEASSYLQGKNHITTNMLFNYNNLKFFIRGDG